MKKVKMLGCSDGDSSVGIPSYCEEFMIDVLPKKVKITPVKSYDDFEPMEMDLTTDLSEVEDKILQKTLFPIINENYFEGELTRLETEAYQKKRLENEERFYKEQYFADNMAKSYKEQESHFKKYHQGDKEFLAEFQAYKRKLKNK